MRTEEKIKSLGLTSLVVQVGVITFLLAYFLIPPPPAIDNNLSYIVITCLTLFCSFNLVGWVYVFLNRRLKNGIWKTLVSFQVAIIVLFLLWALF